MPSRGTSYSQQEVTRSVAQAHSSTPASMPAGRPDKRQGGTSVVAELERLTHGEITRRGAIVRAGTTAAATVAGGALSLGAPASAALAAPVEQAAGNTLRLAIGQDPESIDPQKASFVDEIDK